MQLHYAHLHVNSRGLKKIRVYLLVVDESDWVKFYGDNS
jgi:hypothetical protein